MLGHDRTQTGTGAKLGLQYGFKIKVNHRRSKGDFRRDHNCRAQVQL